MKKPIKELIVRYAHQIQLRNPQIPITEKGKDILLEAWRGKEKKLYEKVKDMENKQIQFENLQKRIDHRIVEMQCGVDLLGFPIYIVHELVFENDTNNVKKQKNKSFNQRFLRSKQYEIKQH
jgi:hypothetical protein